MALTCDFTANHRLFNPAAPEAPLCCTEPAWRSAIPGTALRRSRPGA